MVQSLALLGLNILWRHFINPRRRTINVFCICAPARHLRFHCGVTFAKSAQVAAIQSEVWTVRSLRASIERCDERCLVAIRSGFGNPSIPWHCCAMAIAAWRQASIAVTNELRTLSVVAGRLVRWVVYFSNQSMVNIRDAQAPASALRPCLD